MTMPQSYTNSFKSLSLILLFLEFVFAADNITDFKCNTNFNFPLECYNYRKTHSSIKAKSRQFSLDSLVDFKNSDYLDDGIDPFGISQLEKESPLPLPTQILDELFGRRLFNSTMNYIVPMFHVSLPLHTDSGSTVHLAMQAFLGLFSAIAWIATIAIPTLLTGLRPLGYKKWAREETDEDLFQNLSTKFRPLFDEKISSKIGLDWDTCLQKTVCEAYRSPKKYGLLAVPFLVLFPSTDWTEKYPKSKSNNIKFNSSQQPLHDSEEDCGSRYPCFFDILDLLNYLTHVLFFSTESK